MRTVSLWQATRTFFPLFLAELLKRPARAACVVGASDGKFVVPLALHGYRVVAIERNAGAVHGGPVQLPGPVSGEMLGLRKRLQIEGVSDHVEIVQRDLFDVGESPVCDAVWTSCSWHYSLNHGRPLRDFVSRLEWMCRSEGLLGAEFMMPVESRHEATEHYLEQGEIRRYLDGWELLWEAYTPRFVEAPHVEQLEPHEHRMGFVVAQRPSGRTA